jgi:transcriptional regulator with XRE-family HTH domain
MLDDRAQRITALVRFVRNERRLRERAGLSQADTAFLAGLHRTEISLLERHERMPRVGTLVRIFGVLDSDPWELLEGLTWELDGQRGDPDVVDRPGLPDARRRLAVPDPMWRFGLLLTRGRLRAGLALGVLGGMLRLHRSEVSLIERGGREPRLDLLLQLAAAVETPPADLLSGIHWVPGDTISGGRYVARAQPPRLPEEVGVG